MDAVTTPDGKGAARPASAAVRIVSGGGGRGGGGDNAAVAASSATTQQLPIAAQPRAPPSYARSADARRFNSCDAGAKVSWGFPTFIKRQDVAKMGKLLWGCC